MRSTRETQREAVSRSSGLVAWPFSHRILRCFPALDKETQREAVSGGSGLVAWPFSQRILRCFLALDKRTQREAVSGGSGLVVWPFSHRSLRCFLALDMATQREAASGGSGLAVWPFSHRILRCFLALDKKTQREAVSAAPFVLIYQSSFARLRFVVGPPSSPLRCVLPVVSCVCVLCWPRVGLRLPFPFTYPPFPHWPLAQVLLPQFTLFRSFLWHPAQCGGAPSLLLVFSYVDSYREIFRLQRRFRSRQFSLLRRRLARPRVGLHLTVPFTFPPLTLWLLAIALLPQLTVVSALRLPPGSMWWYHQLFAGAAGGTRVFSFGPVPAASAVACRVGLSVASGAIASSSCSSSFSLAFSSAVTLAMLAGLPRFSGPVAGTVRVGSSVVW